MSSRSGFEFMRFYLLMIGLVVAGLGRGMGDEVVWPLPQADTNFLEHIRQARSQRVDMILDGDSITDYWQSTGRPVFDKVFAPRYAIDFGMSGNQTQNVLWRLDHGELDTLHPRLAMLLIGTNNMGQPVEDIAAGVAKIVQEYREKCPDMHVLLLSIFPHGHLPTDPAREKIKAVNALISKLDDGAHVTFLDIGDKFLEPDGTMSAEVMPDFLHPALKGYEIWADAVKPMLDKYCPVDAANAGAVSNTIPVLTTEEVSAAVPTLSWPYVLDAPAGTPYSVYPTYYLNWFRVFQQNLDRLKQGPYDLVLDGDSIIGDWQGRGWPVMQARYGNIKMLDLGTYGDRVQNVLWRVRHGSLDGQDPKLIVLLIGGAHIGEDVKETAGGTKLVLDEYKKRCPHAHILLLGLLPRLPDADSRAWIQQLNAEYATLADERVTFMDIGAKFRQADGTVPVDLFRDGYTPSDKGYAAWTDVILPVVDKYIPQVKH
jgi:lysophospholipase L1-like esterase